MKAQLAAFDRAGLLGLLKDLYAASKDKQAFLHARLDLGGDVLKPYRVTIERWLWPDVFKNQDTSVAKAKKAIADYRQASGTAEGLTELMVFYCEQAAGFSADAPQPTLTVLPQELVPAPAPQAAQASLTTAEKVAQFRRLSRDGVSNWSRN